MPLRETSLVVVLLAVPAVAAGGQAASPSAPHERADRLNIVLILSDDERAGIQPRNSSVRRLLARHGITFTRFLVTTSECCPSRAGILTGQYSHHNGVVQNFGLRSYPSFDERSNLAVWLANAGYDAALVGKYLNDYTVYGNHHVPPGWSDWVAIDSKPEERYYDYVLNENGRLAHFGRRPADYSTDVLARHALRFLRTADEPFFLYFAPVAPHLPATPAPRDIFSVPYPAPPTRPSFDEADISDKPWRRWHRERLRPGALRFLDHDIRQRQLESLRALDRAVGGIVATLRRRGLLDKTVIIYASDNGFLWGEHRLGGKIWPYEESIHVPLVVRVPWSGVRGLRDRHLVLNIDLASTIAELAGVKPGLPQDGRSFVPLLRRQNVPWRHEFIVEYLGASQLRRSGPPPFRALRTERYLYVEYLNGWRELYDLRRDPWELQNAVDDPGYAMIRNTLHARLLALMRKPPLRA
jgi:arylsulfatase A-like enzyme